MIIAAQPDLLLGWMAGLADRIRLRLMRVLDQHELGVAEMCEILQLPQSTVSRHLKVLSEQGWLKSRRQGAVHLYRMAAGELDGGARKLWLAAREQTEVWPAVRQDQLRLARRLQERRQTSEAFFAGAASQWDRLRADAYGRSFSQQPMLALLPADAVVADLGCGTGEVAATLAPWVGRVIGIDNSAAMLKAAGRRTENLASVELRRGELDAIPIEDACCDVAMVLLVLSYVTDAPAVLKEMARILKPGGRAVVVDLLPHDREDFHQKMGHQVMGFELDQVRTMLEESGLKVTRATALPPEVGAKGPALFLASGMRCLGDR